MNSMTSVASPVNCAPVETKSTTVQQYLDETYSNLNDCQGLIDKLTTFVSNGPIAVPDKPDVKSLNDQSALLCNQSYNVMCGLRRIAEGLGAL